MSVAIEDKNIDKSLVLYWKMSGIELAPVSKIFTARCKNLYILTTKHKITARQNRLEYNICAGVCHKSIKAQRKTIFLLDLQLQHLEYKYQHDL